jgi:hypothetical protein
MQLAGVRNLYSLLRAGLRARGRWANTMQEAHPSEATLFEPAGSYYALPYHSLLHCTWLNDIATHHSLTRLGP